MSGILDGIRVIEWGAMANGPLAASMLGDLGAEVIKLEQIGTGDPARGIESLYGAWMKLPNGRNTMFEVLNRNKRGITLDLSKQKAMEVISKLIKRSDVFLTNYSRDRAKKYGLNYDSISAINPNIIYSDMYAYGSQGPFSQQRSYDPCIMAYSGMMTEAGEEDMPPIQIQGGVADVLGATLSAYAVVAALLGRERHHVGQLVETSQLHGMLWLQTANLSGYLIGGRTMKRYSRRRARNPLTNHYCCKDQKWIQLGEAQADKYWGDFCRIIRIEYLIDNPISRDLKARRDHSGEIVRILEEVFVTKTRDEWLAHFKSQDAKFGYAPINEINEIPTDSQVAANKWIKVYDHPALGPIRMLDFPATFTHTPATIRLPAPELGQHTEEVLLKVCGYTWEEITKLKELEVI